MVILSPQDKIALSLNAFRKAFGAELSKEEAINLWGNSLTEESLSVLNEKQPSSSIMKSKLTIAKDLVRKVPYFGVKYIGVSGSVGSGTAEEGDDIDIFIVVSDNISWIYRFFSKIILGKNAVWYGEEDQKDRLCINFICEEKGLNLDNHDIFTFNEIVSLQGIYNSDYLNELIRVNRWLFKDFLIEDRYGDQGLGSNSSIIIKAVLYPVNLIFFITQVLYMALMGHQPNYGKLFNGFRNGRIQFYPDQFREEKLRKFKSCT